MDQTVSPRCTASVRLAVFDVDGTLVDSQDSIVAAMEAAWTAYAMTPPPRGDVLRVVGLPLLEAVGRLAPDVPADRRQSLRERYSTEWSRMRAEGRLHEPFFPGAREVLDVLEADGWLLGVATGKSRPGLIKVLDSHGITRRFVTLQTSDLSPGKPNPTMLEKAMAEAGSDRSTTAMVGDTVFDIQMARNAGTYAVGVAWGYHDVDELRAAGAHTVIGDFAELPAVLAGLIEGGAP